MSKRIFTKEQINTFLQNQNVAKCSEKSISYDKNFKILAIRKHREGLSPREIFKQANFDINIIGKEIPDDCLYRWRKTFKQKGDIGLRSESRGKKGGRPKIKWLNEKEKIKYLETEIAYLREENHFLAKLRKKSLN